ncbi:hypothetical protein PGTUg99_032446 [Puccinia graminis f. sp. tritici]|uniref:Uncharacterized protein n=1 Tax=Puccinia graminis f. sp. tritici TaxID=56615 RepID=A0A5B0R911_PUCGR|nr:hypothetical protein PGTUg99_032446 [Puccinia graminis f. sp. tritici]
MCTRGGSVYRLGLNTRMKRKEPETERQPAGQTWEIINVDKIEASQDSGASSTKRSRAWAIGLGGGESAAVVANSSRTDEALPIDSGQEVPPGIRRARDGLDDGACMEPSSAIIL